MTDPLAAFLATVFKKSGLVLHGGTPIKKRPELVKQFQRDEGPPFFVISLKAGGSGLNLTAALPRRPFRPLVEPRRGRPSHRSGVSHRSKSETCCSLNSYVVAPWKSALTK